MSKEAMKLVLEALEAAYARIVTKCEQNLVTFNGVDVDTLTLSQEAITALREALAEQTAQQEPVAWMYPDDYERMSTSETFCTVYSVEVGSATRGESTVALYTSPTAQPDKKQQALDKMADNAKELGLDYEPATYTFKQSSELMIATFDMKPNHNMTFHNQDGKHVGTLDFNGPEMVFTGDADESVKVFFDFIANAFKARLEQERADEREACAKVCEERIEFWQRDDGRRYEDEYCAAAIREMGNT